MKTKNPVMLQSLGFQTPIEAQASDHQPYISGGVLFFNMMMQGSYNETKYRFNNGFALFENKTSYHRRLRTIAKILAEISTHNPHIYAIGLAEAPIKEQDIDLFIRACCEYPSLNRFKESMTRDAFTSLGIASFFDSSEFEIKRINDESLTQPNALKNRFQLTEIIDRNTKQLLRVCTLHLPYDLAKSENKKPLITFISSLFNSINPTIVMGDFNIDPAYLQQYFPQHMFEGLEQTNLLVETDKYSKAIIGHQFDCVDAIIRNKSKLRDIRTNELSPQNILSQFMANQGLAMTANNRFFKTVKGNNIKKDKDYSDVSHPILS